MNQEEQEKSRGNGEVREHETRMGAYLAGQVDEQVGNQAATATGLDSAMANALVAVANKLTSCLWLISNGR